MGTFIILAPLIIQILIKLPSLINAAEVAFSGKGTGKQKKEFVLLAAGGLLDVASKVGVSPLANEATKNAVLETIGSLVDSTVSGLNTVDAWKRD